MNKYKDKIQNNFFQYFAKFEEGVGSVIIELGYEELAPISELSHIFRFKLFANEVLENKFPTKEESEILYNIGDELEAELNKHNCACAGYFLGNGIREIFYYTDNTVDLKEITDNIMSRYENREYECSVSLDKEWDLYFNFLKPNEYEYQSSLDNQLIGRLEQQGDNVEAEREVDFYMYFEKREDAENVFKILNAEGFNCTVEEHEDGKFGLSAIRVMPIIPDIYSVTQAFITLCKDNSGNFDGWGCTIVNN